MRFSPLLVLISSLCVLPVPSLAFLARAPRKHAAAFTSSFSNVRSVSTLPGTKSDVSSTSRFASPDDPQVFGTGYSAKADLLEALQEATDNAIQSLPKSTDPETGIDLAIITISSLYDGQTSPSVIVPAVLSSASVYGKGIQHLVGCTAGGIVSSVTNFDMQEKGGLWSKPPQACFPVESEGIPAVSVTLALLPDVDIKASTK